MCGFVGLRALFAGVLFAVAANAGPALAQKGFTRPVEIIAPASPGGGWDMTARLLARSLQEEKVIRRPITVVNKPGGSGVAGWNYMNSHGPDGHYVAMGSTMIHAHRLLGRGTMSLADITPLAMLTTEWHAVVVGKGSPIRTGKELMSKLKEDPMSLSIGVGIGVGSDDYMSFMKAAKGAGVDVSRLRRIAIFPSGNELIAAIIAGQVDVISTGLSEAIEQHRANAVRIVAISAPRRLEGRDADLPTWEEQGIAGEFGHWRGLFGPGGMSREQVATWDAAIGKVVRTKTWKQGIARHGWHGTHLDSTQFQAFLERENISFEETFDALGIVKRSR